MKPKRTILRRLAALGLCAASVWTVCVTADAASPSEAAQAVASHGAQALHLLRWELGDVFDDSLSFPTWAVLQELPLLFSQHEQIAQAWSSDVELPPASDSEDREGSILAQTDSISHAEPEHSGDIRDNGAPARTLLPSDTTGYTVAGGVYINNATDFTLDVQALSTGEFAAAVGDAAPQILIIHTHGSEAYTMPPGEEYTPTDAYRTTDAAFNMIRVGDEMAQQLTQCGLSVLHDRSLYDYPSYNGAYERSLASIRRYLEKYPSITFVLDVHRDAVANADGAMVKVVTAQDPATAQIEMVLGTSGGGAKHEHWMENLKLAAAVQRTAQQQDPTLMRPIVLRNSRYNQHATTGSLLVEIGSAGNSLQEALNAARLFAQCFARTVQKA